MGVECYSLIVSHPEQTAVTGPLLAKTELRVLLDKALLQPGVMHSEHKVSSCDRGESTLGSTASHCVTAAPTAHDSLPQHGHCTAARCQGATCPGC